MEESPPVSPAQTNRLTVRAIFFGILAGIIGLAGSLLAGIAIGSGLAAAFHVSPMEGGAGYFAVGIALLVTALITPAVVLAVLYWQKVRGIRLLLGLITVCISMIAIGAAGFGAWYVFQPHILNPNAATPTLEVEVKPPDGRNIEMLAKAEIELDTDRNTMPGYWHDSLPNSGVRSGYVEVYYRTSQRLLVLKFPENEDRVFKLRLPANPMKSKYREWSEWQKPDFVAKGAGDPSRASGENDYQIRYKLDYQER